MCCISGLSALLQKKRHIVLFPIILISFLVILFPVEAYALSALNISVITNHDGEFGFTVTPENKMQEAIPYAVSIVGGVHSLNTVNLPVGTYTVTLTSIPENFTLESITCRVIQERYQNTFTIQTEYDELGISVIAYCTVRDVSFTLSAALSDSMGISDSMEVTKIEFIPEPVHHSLELSDGLEISDSVSVTKIEFIPEPVHHSLELSDGLEISDSVSVTKIEFIPEPVHHSLELSDGLEIRDSVSVTKIEFIPEPVHHSLESRVRDLLVYRIHWKLSDSIGILLV